MMTSRLRSVLALARGRLDSWTIGSVVTLGLYSMTPAYVIAMLIYPFLAAHWDWKQVHQVWYDWQSLNVGMLALISSAIFFRASKYQSDAQRGRDFRAAQAFLPAALHDLTHYLRSCAAALDSAWHAEAAEHGDDGPPQRALDTAPQLPDSHREVFAQCIRYAEPMVGDFLAKVLADLQVLDARLSDLLAEASGHRVMPIHGPDVLLSYIHSLGILQARINRLFPFGRNEQPLDVSAATWDELENAYRNLDVRPDHYQASRLGTLEAFSKRWIDRHRGERF